MHIGLMMAISVLLTAINVADGERKAVSLRSTDRLPEASGAAVVERRGGTTIIDVRLDAMRPAWLFGGDYNTYVLWVVPPGGGPQNAGEFHLHGDDSALRARTSAPEFGLLITAEPHFLSNTPSSFVIFETRNDTGRQIDQPLLTGVYHFQRTELSNTKEADSEVRNEVRQAFIALRLAVRARAHEFAPEEFEAARRSLDETMRLAREKSERSAAAEHARATIRLAVAAQRLAENRATIAKAP